MRSLAIGHCCSFIHGLVNVSAVRVKRRLSRIWLKCWPPGFHRWRASLFAISAGCVTFTALMKTTRLLWVGHSLLVEHKMLWYWSAVKPMSSVRFILPLPMPSMREIAQKTWNPASSLQAIAATMKPTTPPQPLKRRVSRLWQRVSLPAKGMLCTGTMVTATVNSS